MSYYNNDESPASDSSAPGQYPPVNYQTPSQNYHPPPLPALPGTAQLQPVTHYHGYACHGSPEAIPAAVQLQMMHHHPFVGSQGNGSPEESLAKDDTHVTLDSNNGSSANTTRALYATPVAQTLYATPTAVDHYYRSEAYSRVFPANSRKSPFSSQPTRLPPAPALTVSPPEKANAVYQKSPYLSEAPSLDNGSGSSESSSSASSTSSRPMPAKSAFMCFSEFKKKEICDKIGAYGKSGSVEAVAYEWRNLSKQERAYWESMAKKEKKRFDEEKKVYKGPIGRKLRAKKDPLAPKRPMSAFLMYAQVKRKPLQRENPDMPNADISRLLGELWRNSSMTEKRPFLEREEAARKVYRAKMEAWKNNEKLAKSMKKSPATQVAVSFTREEPQPSESDERVQDATYSTDAPTHYTRENPASYAENQAGSPSYEGFHYPYVTWTPNNWTPNQHYHQSPSNFIQYSYPRPREDQNYEG